MSPKELKKLAKECRLAGIKHYKCAEFEFTLSDDAPVSNYKRKAEKAQGASMTDPKFETDSLTEEQLLYWSTGLESPENQT